MSTADTFALTYRSRMIYAQITGKVGEATRRRREAMDRWAANNGPPSAAYQRANNSDDSGVDSTAKTGRRPGRFPPISRDVSSNRQFSLIRFHPRGEHAGAQTMWQGVAIFGGR